MGPPVSSKRLYRFGLFEADAESGKLLREGTRVRLQDQPFRVLCLLLERAGSVVTREEIKQSLWSDNTYVEFDGSLNAALKKLRFALGDPAENPVFIETLPKRGYRFMVPVSMESGSVARVEALTSAIAQAPAQGPRETTAAQEDSGGIQVYSPERAGRPRKQLGFALILAAIVVLVVASYHRLTSAGENPTRTRVSQPPPSVRPRASIAVLGFNNISGRSEDAWLSTALSEMLSTELSAGDRVRLVPGEEVAHLRMVSPWMQTGTLGQETSSRIGSGLNSDVLVLGSFASIPKQGKKQFRVDVRMQDASTGNVLFEVAETDTEDNLFHVASVVGSRLREKLSLPANSPLDRAAEMASLPSNPEAARFYALGLDKLREFDVLAAKDLFEQTVTADPRFPIAHSMLARAWHGLGYEPKRKDEAKIALNLSANLSRVDHMLVEGDYYESLANHEKAASIYHALFVLFPDSVDYGLQLALTQSAGGNANQAVETLAQLRRLPLPASSDPRIDLAESRAIPNNKPQALVLVREAMSKASAQGKKLIYAQARNEECMNLIYGEHPDQGAASCEDAYKIFLAAGNRPSAADCLRLIADSQGAAGHYEDAIGTYEHALSTLRGLGEDAKTGAVFNNMAGVFLNEGKLDRAEQFYRQSKDLFEKEGNPYNAGTATANIADILYLRGNLPGATKLYRQAIEIGTPLGPSHSAYPKYRLADLELAQGRLQDSQRSAREAVESLREPHGAYQYFSAAMIVLGETLQSQGDLKGAREQYQAALDLQQKTGETDLASESQVELAQLSLEEGDAGRAEPMLRPAIAEFEKEKADPDATGAYIVLSRALLAQGKIEEARKAIQHASELARKSPDPALKLPIAIQSARIDIAAAGAGAQANVARGSARQKLRSALSTAKQLGYYNLECEARLALGELELKEKPSVGRSLLKQLADDANGRGLQLIARKANDLASRGEQARQEFEPFLEGPRRSNPIFSNVKHSNRKGACSMCSGNWLRRVQRAAGGRVISVALKLQLF